jgi:signal transduction histidine kinase
MGRLRFSTRIALIVVTGVATVWIGAVALVFVSQSRAGNGAQPLPTQIVAIVDLIERTSRDQQQPILDALTSETLHARVEAGHDIGPSASRPLLRLGERTLERYLSVLGGRPLSVSLPEGARRRRWLSLLAPDALEFRIALKTDQTLVIDTRSAALVTLFGLPVGFGVGLFGSLIALVTLQILHRETRPLVRLAADVDAIDPTRVNAPLAEPPRSAPEIAALIAAFNRLQTRLGHLMKARMAMMGGISHDVRTFATRLRLRVDAIPDGEQHQRAVGDIDDMIRLLDDALLASRAGVGEEMVEVDEVVRADVADRVANGAAITCKVDERARATILGDRLAMRRVVANLIDNAMKYGSRVEVGLASIGEQLVLTVDDDGPGIPVDQRELLLEPFVRLDSSRNRATGGAGLGLAIVRSLVEAMGGSVRIEDASIGGARLVVRLPKFVA